MANGIPRVTLVVYPAESVNRRGYEVGHIYVNDGNEKFEVAGGPRTPVRDGGGHTATRTPPGHYVLDRAEHHTTSGWPNSVVPWGARIREVDEVVQFQVGDRWIDASGSLGKVTEAYLLWYHRSNRRITTAIASRYARQMFYKDGVLMSQWLLNDFGQSSWNLKKNGARTAFFIHTTPEDEAMGSRPFELTQSHGCLHIRPSDRDTMVNKGYLAKGVAVIVKRYEDRRRP
jgi:hypothetical protein